MANQKITAMAASLQIPVGEGTYLPGVQSQSAVPTNVAMTVGQLRTQLQTIAWPVSGGGTGLTATPTNGQLLIGTGAGFAYGTLTAGNGVGVANGSGTVTLTSGMGLIQTQTPSGVGSVTFSSLGSYGSLMLTGSVISGAAAANSAVNITFNADTGAHYAYQLLSASSTTLTGSYTSGASNLPIAYATASTFSSTIPASFSLNIFDYGGSTFQKTVISSINLPQSGAMYVQQYSGLWTPASPAAITSITLTLASGNFVAGSRISLYGITQ